MSVPPEVAMATARARCLRLPAASRLRWWRPAAAMFPGALGWGTRPTVHSFKGAADGCIEKASAHENEERRREKICIW